MERAANCNHCGKFFEPVGLETLCRSCFEADMTEYDKIRQYLYAHPKAKIFEVSNNLDVPISHIKRYLREDRLEIVEKVQHFLKCDKCGKPISSGILCNDCKKEAGHDFKTAYTGNHEKEKQSARSNRLKYV